MKTATTATIDYFLTMNSPWSYLGAGRLGEIAKRHGYKVNVFPTRFGPVFEKSGGLPLEMRAQARKDYRQVELARWIKFLDMPVNRQPKHFPVDDTLCAQAVIAAQGAGLNALGLSQEIGRAQWELQQDISHMGTIAAACSRAGISLSALGTLDQFAAQFDDNTDQAIKRGVFGYPSYFVGDEMFWGQDRLDFLERALQADLAR